MAEQRGEVELIAGEMRLWSDNVPGARRSAARGSVAAALVAAVLTDAGAPVRVLVAGPHAGEVTQAVAGSGHEAVFVVRSLSDADALSARHPGVRVVCGGLDAFKEEPFDVVVALDGAERILSNDSPQHDWRGRVELLVGLLAEHGTMLFSLDNPLSLAAFADARSPAERRDTGDWEPPSYVDPSRPASLSQARAVLEGLRLTVSAHSAFPLTTAPAVVAEVEMGDLNDLRVQRAIRISCTQALAGRELLFDPTAETMSAIVAGRGPELAPGWVFMLTRGAATTLPQVVFEDYPGRLLAAVLGLEDGQATVLAAGSAGAASRGAHLRPLTRSGPAEGTLAEGRLLAGVLADLALAEDLVALRSLSGSYLSWVRDSADLRQAVFATPDNTLTGDPAGSFALLDGTWSWSDGVTADLAVARVALATARGLLDRRLRQIWPPWMGVAELASSLASRIGADVPAEVWGAASALDVALAGPVEPGVVLNADLRGLRSVNEQLSAELEAARGELFAHQRLVENRDRQLEQRSNRVQDAQRAAATARAELDTIRSSNTHRVGRALRHPVRSVRAVARRLRHR